MTEHLPIRRAAAFLAAALAVSCGSARSSSQGSSSGDAVCPPNIEATFDGIRTAVFEASCETQGSCHSAEGAVDSGQLDLETDPYVALLGPDGKGAPANNISGSEKGLSRVVPGDPDHSFLLIKLRTRSSDDPRYGSGMPWTAPGSVCEATLSAIASWIRAGAPR